MTHVRVVVSSRPQRRWHMQRHTCPAGPLDPHPAVPYADQGWQCWCAQHDGLPGDVPAAAVSMDGWSLCRHSHRQRTVLRTLWQGGTCHVCTPPPNLPRHMPVNMHAHACPKVLLCTFARRVYVWHVVCGPPRRHPTAGGFGGYQPHAVHEKLWFRIAVAAHSIVPTVSRVHSVHWPIRVTRPSTYAWTDVPGVLSYPAV